jgi:hypothetical protein
MKLLEKHVNSNLKYTLEVFLALFFVILVSLKSHPFGITLGENINMMTLSLSVILFFIFIFFIWGEKGEDERDEHNKYIISRYSYLFGTSSLILAITYQDLIHHMVDPWLIFTLSVMVFTKIFGRIYIKLRE